MKKNESLETLLQKYVMASGQAKKLLLAIIKNKYPDAKVPK